MQVVTGCLILGSMAAIGCWYHFGPAKILRRVAHYLLATAAGYDARDRALAEAMKQTVRLEESNG